MQVADEGRFVGCTCDDMIGRALVPAADSGIQSLCERRPRLDLVGGGGDCASELRSSLSRRAAYRACSLSLWSACRLCRLFPLATVLISLSRPTHGTMLSAGHSGAEGRQAVEGAAPSAAAPSSDHPATRDNHRPRPVRVSIHPRPRREIGKRPPSTLPVLHMHRAASPARCAFACLPSARPRPLVRSCCCAWPTLD